MSDLANSFSKLINEFPELAHPDSGLLIFLATVLIAAGVLLIRILWDAISELLKDDFKALLGSPLRRVFAFVWVIAIAVGAGTHSWYLLAAALACGPLAWWLRLRLHRARLTTALVCALLAGGAFALDNWLTATHRRNVKVYFVLAFQNEGDITDLELIKLYWKDCWGKLLDVFADVEQRVEIMPTSQKITYDDVRFDEPYKKETLKRLFIQGQYADRVLQTTAHVLGPDHVIKLTLKMSRMNDKGEPIAVGAPFELTRRDDAFLTLKVALWVRDTLSQGQDRLLDQPAQAKVDGHLLDEYAKFLMSQRHPNAKLIKEVQQAAGNPEGANIAQLFEKYKTPEDTPLSEKLDKRQRKQDLAKSQGTE
jgi:hypothetical protein